MAQTGAARLPDIDILVCTIDGGIGRVPGVLMPPAEGVRYVVSMQYTDARFLGGVPAELRRRADVALATLPGRGLSRNRNHALRQARAELLLLADDDGRLDAGGIRALREAYAARPELDIALVRMTDYGGRVFKAYPDGCPTYARAVAGGYHVASWEMSMRRRVAEHGLRFDERFGLGAERLCCGEEEVLLKDAADAGLHVRLLPIVVGATDPATTGTRLAADARVQRSKGAALYYVWGLRRALWLCLRAAARAMLAEGANPLALMCRMVAGMRYVRSTPRPETD